MMKKYLNRDHDVVGGADYIINIYKGDFLDQYQGDAREALAALWLSTAYKYQNI